MTPDNDNEELNRIRRQVGDLLAHTLDRLATLDGDLGEYGRSLQTFTASLGENLDITDIGEVFQNIIAEVLLKMESERTLTRDLSTARVAASHDALTGLFNRGHFDLEIEQRVEKAHRSGDPLALLIVDIDHFKSVNDTWGHQAGDAVIRAVAEILRDTVKGKDIAARYGGEEFAVLLPNTGPEGAGTVAEQIRNTVEQAGFGRTLLQAAERRLTVSVGVATLDSGEASGDLIRRADAGLYHAKETGRNRVGLVFDRRVLNAAG